MSNQRVLVVDDNEINLAIVEEMLDGEYDVRTARSGEEALRLALQFEPRVILLDVMMPDLDGYETCQLLRSHPDLRGVRIIMVSAKAMPSERQAGYAAGADDYITKPFDDAELLSKLRRETAGRRKQHQLR
jgi:CheY-like chemotaxis protein